MRILCVDDDDLVLSVIADLLRSLGHEVVEANDGEVAAQAIKAVPPIDVLVTDIHMPGGLGGLELADHARRHRPGLGVIYFSGLAHVIPLDVRGTVLHKPCSLGELETALERVMH